jgi:hypothetical protein
MTGEKEANDAPCYLSASEASAWASGFNAAHDALAPILAEKEREIERLKLDRDEAQINEAEAIDLMNEYKALLEAAEAAAIRAQGE